MASPQELEAVIADPGSLTPPQPVETVTRPIKPAPRYTADAPYTPDPVIYSAQDLQLMERIRTAVQNGWTGFHRYANDAVTIGLEPEAVIAGMRKQRMDAAQLLFDDEFIRAMNA